MHASTECQSSQSLNTLVSALGIETGYTDVFGRPHTMSEAARDCILKAFGLDPAHPQAALDAMYFQPERSFLEPAYVVTASEIASDVSVTIRYAQFETRFEWLLSLESGESRQGEFYPNQLPVLGWPVDGTARLQLLNLPTDLPWGYHQLTLKNTQTGDTDTARFIVTPNQCYRPEALKHSKLWGPAVQLYSLKSDSNWGMGDLADLDAVIDWCSENGASVIGLNPLHQLFPNNVHHISPYSPSSQTAFNIWYLRPEAVSHYEDATDVQAALASPEWQGRLAQYRQTERVDYAGVLSAKFTILKKLYQSFLAQHVANQTSEALAFQEYCENAPAPVHHVALFEALQAHFQAQDASIFGWPRWPEAYHNPYSDVVRTFSSDHRDEVNFYLYLQWQMTQQLSRVTARVKERGLEIGLYLDLSVGVDSSGAQVWANRELYALSARVGCPPDALNQKGQDWGLPPIIPQKLREQGYELFVQMLQENMRYAGALRLDHVMGLYRLFWIPAELGATEGTYVKYPFMDLVKLIALESHRNECVVIGEDLGTIVPAVQEAMQNWQMLSYKVLYFEKDGPDQFTHPSQYTQVALVAAGTHDLPTLQGFWHEDDIRLRTELNLYPSDEMRAEQIAERQVDKQALLNLLHHEGLISDEQRTPTETLSTELITAIQVLLARSNSALQLVQVEDMLGQREQMNVPGTTTEHPNWCQKLQLATRDWAADARIQMVVSALRKVR
jgi:4-alpha-glucanotransferase